MEAGTPACGESKTCSGFQRKPFPLGFVLSVVEEKRKALACVRSGQYLKARTLLEKVCRRNEKDAEGWFLLGAVNGQLGDLDAVIFCCNKTISIDPSNTDAYFNLAQAYMHKAAQPQALAAYQEVLRRQPQNVQALNNLGYLLQKMGEYEKAAEYHQKALVFAPGDPDSLNNLGNACSAAGRVDDAVSCYRQALAIAPQFVKALNNLGAAFQKQKKFEEAESAFDKALTIKPDYVEALINKGIVEQVCGRAEDAHELFRKAWKLDPACVRAVSGLLFNLNYFCDDPELSFRLHQEGGSSIGQKNQFDFQLDRSSRPLRVGYVSADFKQHSVAYFFRTLIANHNSSMVESYCYSDVAQPDAMTEELKLKADQWRDLTMLSPAAVVEAIRDDHIDILVDLAGHTEARMAEIFAHRVAPIQVSWLGYPNTTGLPTMDYRFTDRWADPDGATDVYHTEKLFRLSGGFLCYQAPDDVPEVGGLPAQKNGYVTFGSFNNLAKVTPRVVALWSAILNAVSGARLLMKNQTFGGPAIRERYYQLFADNGVDRHRLEFVGFVSRQEHFDLYNGVDIGLDTFPYNGTTTTCEALWMGVPVITLAGRMHAGRVGVSLLTQTGMEDWIARNEDEYLAIACGRAERLGELGEIRHNLRSTMSRSSLCDGEGFARRVEAAYHTMWEELHEDQSPTDVKN